MNLSQKAQENGVEEIDLNTELEASRDFVFFFSFSSSCRNLFLPLILKCTLRFGQCLFTWL